MSIFFTPPPLTNKECFVVAQELAALLLRENWNVGKIAVPPELLHLLGGQLKFAPVPRPWDFRQVTQRGVVEGEVPEGVCDRLFHGSKQVLIVLVQLQGESCDSHVIVKLAI